jgi:integrase
MAPKLRQSTGGAYESRGKFYMRVTVAAQRRASELLPWCMTLADAHARANTVQSWVNRLRAAGQGEFVETIVEFAAKADDEKMAEYASQDDALVGGDFDRVKPKPARGGTPTFEDFAMQWVRGELAVLYPDHVERKRTAYTDLCNLQKYVFPVVGHKRISDIELEDYEQVMREIPSRSNRKLRSGTRRHVAQVMRRVMQLAEYPAKLITRSPIPANAMPRVRTEVALQYIYPDEEAALMACKGVDLGRRVLWGFMARVGWRGEEALGGKVQEVDCAVDDPDQPLEEVPPLTWRRLDLKHGVVHLDREKTGRPRPVPIDPDVFRALEAWRTLSPASADEDFVFVDMTGALVERHDSADLLRQDLLAAKQDRAELHDTSSPLRRPVRMHDLRASMVTIGLANGRLEEWIRRRTGHTSSALERYRRVAGTLKELELAHV